MNEHPVIEAWLKKHEPGAGWAWVVLLVLELCVLFGGLWFLTN